MVMGILIPTAGEIDSDGLLVLRGAFFVYLAGGCFRRGSFTCPTLPGRRTMGAMQAETISPEAEAAVWLRILHPEGELPPKAARAILQLSIPAATRTACTNCLPRPARGHSPRTRSARWTTTSGSERCSPP